MKTPEVLRSPYFWAVLAVSFLGVSIAGLSREWTLKGLQWNDPDASFRTIAVQRLHIPDALEQLRTALDRIPRDQPILFFSHDHTVSSADTYQLISDLAWPRSVWFAGHLPPPKGTQLGAFLFFEIAPPPNVIGKGQAIGPALYLILSSEIRQPQ